MNKNFANIKYKFTWSSKIYANSLPSSMTVNEQSESGDVVYGFYVSNELTTVTPLYFFCNLSWKKLSNKLKWLKE